MLDYMRKLVDSAGPGSKSVKFAVATFEEVQKAEQRTKVIDKGSMMCKHESVSA